MVHWNKITPQNDFTHQTIVPAANPLLRRGRALDLRRKTIVKGSLFPCGDYKCVKKDVYYICDGGGIESGR